MKRCKHCGRELPDEAFGISLIQGDKVYRRQQCQQCKNARALQRKELLREWCADYKKTLCCLRCGFADFRALAFHHQGSPEKSFNVSDMVTKGHAVASIQREMAKCVVLCCNCHSIQHADERLSAPTVAPQRDSTESTASLQGARKLCRYCLEEQDESCFEVCKVLGNKVYRRHKCRACKRETQKCRLHRLRLWLTGLKKTLHCCACGFDDYRALEFHHPESEEKDFAIGDMVRDNRAIAAVEREIDKCLVLCANCHQIEHFEERIRGRQLQGSGIKGQIDF